MRSMRWGLFSVVGGPWKRYMPWRRNKPPRIQYIEHIDTPSQVPSLKIHRRKNRPVLISSSCIVMLVRHWPWCTSSEGPRLRKINPPRIERIEVNGPRFLSRPLAGTLRLWWSRRIFPQTFDKVLDSLRSRSRSLTWSQQPTAHDIPLCHKFCTCSVFVSHQCHHLTRLF